MIKTIIGIETSCDETACSIVRGGTEVLSNTVATARISLAGAAGVIPEDTARQQLACMLPVLEKLLKESGMERSHLDAVAVTKGPGLLGSLLVGTMTARVVAWAWDLPLIGIHHTFGHLSSTWLDASNNDIPQFPILTLSASGGHTDLWYRTKHTEGKLLGRTRDDAAGEAFDKGAHLLGLGFPGGPAIAKAAEGGDPNAFDFPSPLHEDPSLDFSFSGLKTALLYLLRDLNVSHEKHYNLPPTPYNLANIAASYQHALCHHLVDRIGRALKRFPDVKEVHLVGGVSANRVLRSMVAELLASRSPDLMLRFPSKIGYCTDNAAMIAAAAYFAHQENGDAVYEPFETTATLPLELSLA